MAADDGKFSSSPAPERRGGPSPQSLGPKNDPTLRRDPLDDLAARMDTPEASDPLTIVRTFLAKITGSGTDGSMHTWDHQTNIGQAIAPFGTPGTDSLQCTDATDDSAAIEMNGWKFVPAGTIVTMFEIDDDTDCRYQFIVPIPAPPTQDGSTDYILGYSSASKSMAWLETNTDCDDGGDG